MQHRISHCDAIFRGRAPPDFIHDDEAAAGGVAQDMCRFEHLDHECALVLAQIVGAADAAEDLVDEADLGVRGGHVHACLGENAYQGGLAQECAFSGHVGAGEEPDAGGAGEYAVVGDELAAGGEEAGFDDHVAAAVDEVVGAGVKGWAVEVEFLGEAGGGAGDVEFVEEGGVAAERDEGLDDEVAEGLEDLLLFGADAEFDVFDLAAEAGPGGEVEGARAFAGADCSGVFEDGDVKFGVFAFDVAYVSESRGEFQCQSSSAELFF